MGAIPKETVVSGGSYMSYAKGTIKSGAVPKDTIELGIVPKGTAKLGATLKIL